MALATPQKTLQSAGKMDLSSKKALSDSLLSEASALVTNYHTLRDQMSHLEQLRQLNRQDLAMHLSSLVFYLQFSEKFLEKLVSTKVGVKDK